MKYKYILLFSIIFLLFGCNNDSKENVYTVREIQNNYSAHAKSKYYQDLSVYKSESMELKAEIGSDVKKNSLILKIYSETDQKLWNEYNYKINELGNQLKNKKEELMKLDGMLRLTNDGEKNILKEQIKSLSDSISDLESNIRESNFSKSQLSISKDINAKFDGQLVDERGILKLLSKEKELVMTLSEKELDDLDLKQVYQVLDIHKKIVGEVTVKYVVNNENETSNLANSYYDVILQFSNLVEKKELKENQTFLINNKKTYFLIPAIYVKTKDNKLYVKDKELQKLIEVKGDRKTGYYEIHSGLRDGMVIYGLNEDD